MEVYFVEYTENYIDTDGHEESGEAGPWLNEEDAEKAMSHMGDMEVGGYTRGERMKLYSHLTITSRIVHENFEPHQVY